MNSVTIIPTLVGTYQAYGRMKDGDMVMGLGGTRDQALAAILKNIKL